MVNKFNVQSDNNKLNAETIYVNVCGKYKDMNVMASRTLLVNPIDSQKNSYLLANEVLETVIKALKVGEPINNAYKAGRMVVQNKQPDMLNKLHSNFGFGVRLLGIIICIDRQCVQGRTALNQRDQHLGH